MPALNVSSFFFMLRRPPRSTLFSLHDALPIYRRDCRRGDHNRACLDRSTVRGWKRGKKGWPGSTRADCERSEEHTSELQSHHDLVCRLLLEKKNKIKHLMLSCDTAGRQPTHTT